MLKRLIFSISSLSDKSTEIPKLGDDDDPDDDPIVPPN